LLAPINPVRQQPIHRSELADSISAVQALAGHHSSAGADAGDVERAAVDDAVVAAADGYGGDAGDDVAAAVVQGPKY
jgi:hypothetical protein